MALTFPRSSLALIVGAVLFVSGCTKEHVAVTTYHYDNLRTGWNRHEERLKPKNVRGPKFGLLYQVSLDDQVDAQPLIVPRIKITGGPSPGEHEVVYVATESNTVYAIDAISGKVLLSPNFGTPVPAPLGCNNNGPNVGINGTPVIDREAKTIYVMVYRLEAGTPAYRLHALDLGTLTDKVSPVLVSASHNLTSSAPFAFSASHQRQRPGLLLANGNVYAGFGSFCDFGSPGVTGGPHSRGWLLGWNARSLDPLPANQMNDLQTTAPNNTPYNRFLASIWMSGFGLASDEAGHLYFVTGNSDSNYSVPDSIQESVVKMSPDLTTILSYFTPSNQASLDSGDTDYGSGGAMLLPDQPEPTPHLLAAAGKDGNMYVLNRDNLGGYTSGGPNNVVGQASIGGCWCGQSFFSRHGARIVSSGGSNVIEWKVQTSPTFSITNEASSPSLPGAQDPGFFTSVSSHEDDDTIIWAVSRPINSSPANISLFAFDAQPTGGGSTLTQLFSGVAGTWPNTGGNANIVPVVANGRVFVASNQNLAVFGLQ
ncbi:MAG TPA: hypothetical protein VIW68_14320 [Candidatus Sulfotelmatobacter sp.]